MAKTRKIRRSRFEGVNLDTLNQEAAKVTKKEIEIKNDPIKIKEKALKSHAITVKKEATEPALEAKLQAVKRGKGRPKTSKRKPLNTAIEPKNKQRLEFLAMLNGGSIADQLNKILEKYFTEIERVDELIEIFEAKKKKE